MQTILSRSAAALAAVMLVATSWTAVFMAPAQPAIAAVTMPVLA